jgi:hypothetical protein
MAKKEAKPCSCQEMGLFDPSESCRLDACFDGLPKLIHQENRTSFDFHLILQYILFKQK